MKGKLRTAAERLPMRIATVCYFDDIQTLECLSLQSSDKGGGTRRQPAYAMLHNMLPRAEQQTLM